MPRSIFGDEVGVAAIEAGEVFVGLGGYVYRVSMCVGGVCVRGYEGCG